MTPRALLALAASGLFLAACSDAPPAPDPSGAQTPAVAGDPPARDLGEVRERTREVQRDVGALRERARALRDARGRWWEDPDTLSELGIDSSGQAALVAALERGQSALRTATAGVEDTAGTFRAALASGDLAGARQAAERHADQLRAQALARQLVAVDALEALPEAQRQSLLERPGLLAALVREGRAPGAALRARRADRRGGGDED